MIHYVGVKTEDQKKCWETTLIDFLGTSVCWPNKLNAASLANLQRLQQLDTSFNPAAQFLQSLGSIATATWRDFDRGQGYH